MPLNQEFNSNMPEYEIKIYTCPCSIPLHIVKHPWITIRKGKITDRYEVLHRAKKIGQENFICINQISEPDTGLEKWSGSKKHWDSNCIGTISGNDESLAHKMYDFVKNESPHYKYKDNYSFYPGPNSNTYIQWILDKFPETNIKLPWNAFGKKYK